MRVCPVCNETFPEEMKFCDLDGARLHRDGESVAKSQGKLWSLLGVGVVFGSLVIIALAIFFSPRTPAPVTSYTPPAPSSESKPAVADTASAYQPEVVEEEAPIAELKKREKPLDSANSNTGISPLNPKAAAQEAEDKTDTQPVPNEVKEAAQPDPKKAESLDPPKTVKAADPGESSKTTQPSVEAKKETKSSKDSDRVSDKKDEKKGGFLKVFRKIFGGKKDEKEKKN